MSRYSGAATYISAGIGGGSGVAPRVREVVAEQPLPDVSVPLLRFPIEFGQIDFTLGDGVALAGVTVAVLQYVHNVRQERPARKQAKGKG